MKTVQFLPEAEFEIISPRSMGIHAVSSKGHIMETIQVNINEAGAQLPKLVLDALSGKEVIIYRDNQPLVRLDVLGQNKTIRKIGNAKGLMTFMADDFDEPLDDFKEYMT